MSQILEKQPNDCALARVTFVSAPRGAVTDKTGFEVFSGGDLGRAHAEAHNFLDRGDEQAGFFWLGKFLEDNSMKFASRDLASKSDWIHLQWHMAVFEIAVGERNAAHERFREHILPRVAAGTALTDGPSLLWRLWLADLENSEPSRTRRELEWGQVRDAGLVYLLTKQNSCDPYIALHCLLALAGARDVLSIDRFIDCWCEGMEEGTDRTTDRLLLQMAWGLRTFANRDFGPSGQLLNGTVRLVSTMGGSAAQNELFVDLRRAADVA